MNKAYRIVWSKARSAFIVTHEKSASRGKSSTTCAAVTLGVAAALMTAGPTLAANLCGSTSTVINTVSSSSDNCILGPGASVSVGSSGSINTTGAAAVSTRFNVQGISNAGTVSTDTRVAVSLNVGTTVQGDIRNSGTINSVSDGMRSDNGAIYGNGANINGSIINDHGQMNNSIMLNQSTVTNIQNINGGNIGVAGTQVAGIRIDNSTISNGILNGVGSSITADDYSAIRIYGGSIGAGGIVNHGTISNTVSLLAGVVNNGDILNTGVITSGPRFSGIALLGATVKGAIRNTSTASIDVDSYGVVLSAQSKVLGGIVNDGTLRGGEVGIYLSSKAEVLGGIVNSGTISGTKYVGITVEDSAIAGGIRNTGTIQGVRDGIKLQDNATLTAGADNVAIFNSNKILATDRTNPYTSNYYSGINLQSGSTITGDLVNTQAGTIDGKYGINVSGASHLNGNVANSGTISGELFAVYVSDDSTLSSLSAHGTAVKYQGDIYAKNTDFTVAAGASFTNEYAIVVQGFNVERGGVLMMANGYTISGLLNSNGITVGSKGFTNAGTVFLDGGVDGQIHGNYTQTATGVLDLGNYALLEIDGTASNAGTMLIRADGRLMADSLTNNSGATIKMENDADIVTTNGFNNNGVLSLASGVSATVRGNYTQTSTGVLRVGVSDDTTYAKLNVQGTVNLGRNAKIDVDVSQRDYKFSVDRLQNILRATTLNSDGTFEVTDNSVLFDFGAIKDGNAVHLTLEKAKVTVLSSVKDANNTPALGAATVLDQVITANPGGAIGSHFVGLTNKQAVSDAVSQTLPLLNGGSMAAATGSITSINRVVQARIENNRGLSSGDDAMGDKYVWFKPFGSWARQDDRDGQSGFKANSTGFVAGADMATNERSRLGIGFAYAKSKVDGNSAIAPQHMDVDVFQLLGYGSYSLDENTDLNFQADVGQNSNKGSRRIAFTGSTASADYKSLTAHVGVGIGRLLALNAHTSFTPSVRADYTWIKDQSYEERGAGALNLNVAGRSANELLLAIDGKLTHKLNDKTTLVANLGTAYTAVKGNTAIIASFAGAPQAAFATYGMEQRPWMARGGLGLVRKTGNGIEIAARYDVEARSSFVNQTASVKARWAF